MKHLQMQLQFGGSSAGSEEADSKKTGGKGIKSQGVRRGEYKFNHSIKTLLQDMNRVLVRLPFHVNLIVFSSEP